MVDATHISYAAADRSYFSLLKKDIHQQGRVAGFGDTKLAELDIIIAELTSNLHKYANDGELLAGLGQDSNGEYLEIISIDNGPGIAEPVKMMQDGYSTGSTLGHGLGSIKRLSDKLEIFSMKGWGTIVLIRIYKDEVTNVGTTTGLDIRALVVSKPGEKVSGDGTIYMKGGKATNLLVADGLGHGPDANLAVNEAVKSFRNCLNSSPAEALRYIHQDIRRTRGMVGTVVSFDLENKLMLIAGIGNISAKLLKPGGEFKNHISYNGIVGHNIPNSLNNQEYAFADYGWLILCSDGIKSRWDVSKYTGINRCDPMLMAAAIYKDFARRTDDTSVVVVKLK